MRKTILSLAFAGMLMLAASACSPTKNVSGSSDSTVTDSASMSTSPTDTAMRDTSRTMPPDTTRTP